MKQHGDFSKSEGRYSSQFGNLRRVTLSKEPESQSNNEKRRRIQCPGLTEHLVVKLAESETPA